MGIILYTVVTVIIAVVALALVFMQKPWNRPGGLGKDLRYTPHSSNSIASLVHSRSRMTDIKSQRQEIRWTLRSHAATSTS
jgi:hypothetical protein